MSDLPKARLLPGIPFEAKARKKRRKGDPAPASTCTPSFEEIRPFLTGKPLRVVSDAVAEKTAQQWQDYVHRVGLGEAFLNEIRVILDREEPDYRL